LPAPLAAMRLLVAREVGLGMGGITRLQVAQGVDRPREVSSEALGAIWGHLVQSPLPTGGAPWSGPLEVRRGASVRLPAPGHPTLKRQLAPLSVQPVELLLHGRVLRRFWLSSEVPLLGLVLLEWPGMEQTLEMAAFGHDARPRLALPSPLAPQLQLER